MMKDNLPFRQVHLDFHTSEHVKKVGAKFDPNEFADILEKARVNSVTCFARCHHGWLYYDSKRFAERVHPNLANRNLLTEQIKACHDRDIRVPVYTSVQVDEYTAARHPEWAIVSADGKINRKSVYEPGFNVLLCVNSPYRDFIKDHIADIFEHCDVDALFFDILMPQDCSCRYCVDGMKRLGIDPLLEQNRRRYYQEHVLDEFEKEMTIHIRSFSKDCGIFYNSGHISPDHRAKSHSYSHFELESLPTGGWGYMHFPTTVRYARTLFKDYLGMTGKFHTAWGDFHSFKPLAALEYECYQMLAMGAKCSIGDQLVPDGKLCEHVYSLIGSVYEKVEQKEPWCKDVTAITDIAVLTTEECRHAKDSVVSSLIPPEIIGVTRMLQEGSHQFDIIDSKADFSLYKVIVLPDNYRIDVDIAEKLESYVGSGGSIIASYKSGMSLTEEQFVGGLLNIKFKGEAPYSPDYIVPNELIGKKLPQTEHVMYKQAVLVEAGNNADVLLNTIKPLFNRTYEHFCSHKHAPSSGIVGYPALLKSDKVIYFAHPIFEQYYQNAPRWCREIFLDALAMLLPDPLLAHDGPTTMLSAVNEQKEQNRWIVHLLNYVPERRGIDFDIIEDVIPVHDITCTVSVPCEVKEVVAVPQMEKLQFERVLDGIKLKLPKLDGHQVISIEFA